MKNNGTGFKDNIQAVTVQVIVVVLLGIVTTYEHTRSNVTLEKCIIHTSSSVEYIEQKRNGEKEEHNMRFKKQNKIRFGDDNFQ